MDDYDIATCATEHADKVLRASGSALKHYTTPAVRKAILSAMLDAIEEAYREGAKFAETHCAATIAAQAAEIERLREAAANQNAAIAEYYRYWTGGETRGSYDGKPERNALWASMYKARAVLATSQVRHD